MTQYMRWKQVKQTGKITREYLSMVDGEAPYMTFKFLPWLTSARSSVSATAVTCTTVLLPDLLFLHCHLKIIINIEMIFDFKFFPANSKWSYVWLGHGRRGRLTIQTTWSSIGAGLHGCPSLLCQFLQILVTFLPHFDSLCDVAHGSIFCRHTRWINNTVSSHNIKNPLILSYSNISTGAKKIKMCMYV